MTNQEQVIKLQQITPRIVTLKIIGDTDIVLNKMNAPMQRKLIDERNNRATSVEKPDKWESIITSMHWRDGTPKAFSEQAFVKALKENAPCITAFGLKKSWGQAVVRNEIDKYATKFDAGVNIYGSGLVPITFAKHEIDEKLMSPKKGSPVLARLNRFSGWSAEITIGIMENVFSIEQIVNIVNLAGFGLGIGSGRSSGYGRYHVESANE